MPRQTLGAVISKNKQTQAFGETYYLNGNARGSPDVTVTVQTPQTFSSSCGKRDVETDRFFSPKRFTNHRRAGVRRCSCLHNLLMRPHHS